LEQQWENHGAEIGFHASISKRKYRSKGDYFSDLDSSKDLQVI